MILTNVGMATSADETRTQDLELSAHSRLRADATGYVALPGLVNAHDHLEFNLYPRLGRGPYPNSRCWAADVYHPDRDPVRKHLRVPKAIRLRWGGLKNLLNGVTTVCHHNRRDDPTLDDGFPVRVVNRFGWAHSLDFSNDVRERFQATPRSSPFILHLAESTEAGGAEEIFWLDAMRALDARTVLVHGVGIDDRGLALLRQRRSSLVWCPSSNLFMLGRTLDIAARLGDGIPIALGSDSSLTADGDLLDEVQAARRYVDSAAIYHMLTDAPRAMLRLPPANRGDIALFADAGLSPAELLASGARPELVTVGGKVGLVAETFKERLPQELLRGMHAFTVCGRKMYSTCDVAELYRTTVPFLGPDFLLAGKRVGI